MSISRTHLITTIEDLERAEAQIRVFLGLLLVVGTLAVGLVIPGILPRTFWSTGIAAGLLCTPMATLVVLYHPRLWKPAAISASLTIIGVSQSLWFNGAFPATTAAQAELTEHILFSILTGALSATALTLLVGGLIGRRYHSWTQNLEESPAGS